MTCPMFNYANETVSLNVHACHVTHEGALRAKSAQHHIRDPYFRNLGHMLLSATANYMFLPHAKFS